MDGESQEPEWNDRWFRKSEEKWRKPVSWSPSSCKKAALHQELEAAYSYFFEEREKELAKARHNQIVEEAKEESEKIIADIRKKCS